MMDDLLHPRLEDAPAVFLLDSEKCLGTVWKKGIKINGGSPGFSKSEIDLSQPEDDLNESEDHPGEPEDHRQESGRD
jgi:hypothetical protein